MTESNGCLLEQPIERKRIVRFEDGCAKGNPAIGRGGMESIPDLSHLFGFRIYNGHAKTRDGEASDPSSGSGQTAQTVGRFHQG